MATLERSYVRIARRPGHELWLIRWPPGSVAPMHDHGGASSGVMVLAGSLTERVFVGGAVPDWRVELWTAGRYRTFGPEHLHEVANRSKRVAYSLHAYAPRLDSMTFYSVAEGGGVVAGPIQTEGMWA